MIESGGGGLDVAGGAALIADGLHAAFSSARLYKKAFSGSIPNSADGICRIGVNALSADAVCRISLLVKC